MINADGTGLTRLTDNPEEDSGPSWSPDGQKILFMSIRDEQYDVFVMNADGSAQMNLTATRGDDAWPAWSPDGGRIAFESERDSPNLETYEINLEVYLMNSDGSGVARLTNNWGDDGFPLWLPGGEQIVYQGCREVPRGMFSSRRMCGLYVMDDQGVFLYPIVEQEYSYSALFPALSPDGRRIAYENTKGYDREDIFDASDMFVVTTDGAGLVQVVSTPLGDSEQTWSPDSQ